MVDMESMKYIMRYNDYKSDSYSLGSPMNAICSRGDLMDPPEAGGCYDTKVVNGQWYQLMILMTFYHCNEYCHDIVLVLTGT